MIRVAINGYGRIGRVAHRVMLQKHASEMEVVAINAGHSTDLKGWMYLLKYDTSYGQLEGHTLSIEEVKDQEGFLGNLIIDDKKIPVYSQKDPGLLPWGTIGVDVVIESTGHIKGRHHTNKVGLEDHLKAGAKTVVVSAPVEDTEVQTYVLSVNEKDYKGDTIVSNASCTTNCITPVAKVMQDSFGIEKAMMTTVHAYTSDQKLQDGGHKDYRRARAAGENIIPTSTGATIAAGQALPALVNKFAGLSLRVPVAVGSLSDITFLLKKDTTVEEVNAALKAAEVGAFKGIIETTSDPIVSSDIVGNPHSSIVDLSLTQVVAGNMVKVVAWYDNEFGYANRLIEEVLLVGTKH
ncbi:MAG: type I glyceraldehyde-3-phosphate dehydrogenase [Candidatus Levybacteria bacterium]|nr:type I glyceraldehyde-3-phosphate dehydrogenase [Candidatus Levybacteria bacterium]